jgi:hypothetical protein
MNKKPASVQFKFWDSLQDLTAPTEPRLPIANTAQIPAQEQRRLRRSVKRHRLSVSAALLWVTAVALALCGVLFLAVLHIF